MIVFTYKWIKKTVFTHLLVSRVVPHRPRALRDPRNFVAPLQPLRPLTRLVLEAPLQENAPLLLSAFPVFVPSLSWHNDYF
jgi:hypothetical protein